MKFICRILLLTILGGAAVVSVSASKFNGMYGGANIGYVNLKTNVTKNGAVQPIVNSGGVSAVLYTGYGKQSNTFYLGGEFTLPYSNFSGKFKGSRIGSTWGIGFTPRVGYNLTPDVMASIGMGLDTIWFNRKLLYKRIFSLTPKFMIEAFVYENTTLRCDVGYSFGLSNRVASGIAIRKRPQILQLTAGIAHRF